MLFWQAAGDCLGDAWHVLADSPPGNGDWSRARLAACVKYRYTIDYCGLLRMSVRLHAVGTRFALFINMDS
jgi:hypothetical protein